MRQFQVFFMILLTVAVGFLFVRQRAPQDNHSTDLQTQVAMLQETITFFQSQPTPLPSPTDPITSGVLQPPIASSTATIPLPTPVGAVTPLPTPNAQPVTAGPRVSSVATSLEVSSDGCALSPQTQFESFDTIYGVATLTDMEVGDTIHVQFMYDVDGALVYEEMFTVRDPGSFCRWYTVEPDDLGWEAGAYSVTYTVNDNPSVSTTYTIQAAADITQPLAPGAEGDVMEEDGAMMEEGQ